MDDRVQKMAFSVERRPFVPGSAEIAFTLRYATEI